MADTEEKHQGRFMPGPWEVEPDLDHYGRYTIAGVAHRPSTWVDEGYDISAEEGDRRGEIAQEEDHGNAQIISAAPKMYAALRVLTDTKHIRRYLEARDPKALEQALRALPGNLSPGI